MTGNHRLSGVLVCVVGLCAGRSTFAADDAIRRLDNWRAQRDGWQQYRDEAQRQLNFDRRAMERVREMADVGAREREGYKAAEETLKGGPGAVKDAFMRSVAGKPPGLSEMKDDFKRAQDYGKTVNAFDEARKADINQERLQARLDSLQKETVQLERSIRISDKVIEYSAQQAAKLASSSEVWFQRLPEWAQSGLNKVAAAQHRQEVRRAEEARRAAEAARKAEEQRKAQEANTIPPGWVGPCGCPNGAHANTGKWVRGGYYHPESVGLCPAR